MDIKGTIGQYVLSAALAVSASTLTAWRQQGVMATEIANLKATSEQLQKQVSDHQEDIKKMYQIDGKLEQVVEELRNLRADIRQQK